MNEYPKIKTILARDPVTHKVIDWPYSTPEFEYLAYNEWIFTEKVDGTNVRVIWEGGKFRFEGRTDNAQMPKRLSQRLEELFLPKAELFTSHFSDDVCFYGEGYGATIQKGGGNYKPDVRSGFTSKWGDFFAEGIVVRPTVDLFTRAGERVIGKLKHKDFSR